MEKRARKGSHHGCPGQGGTEMRIIVKENYCLNYFSGRRF
jgi:hypothetical protein